MDPSSRISLAITHYCRFGLLQECLNPIINDERIAEIVISDDASIDESYEQLTRKYKDHPKIKLFRNATNLDCYRNKAKAVELATNSWVVLFDSDNILKSDYLDALYRIPQWDPTVIYCPDWAQPHFDYTAFAGVMIDQHNVSQMMGRERMGQVTLRRQMVNKLVLPAVNSRFRTALNTCNYFVHRDEYLSVWDGSCDPHTADSIFQAYNWLKSGRKIFFVPGMRYLHRIHEDSHFKINQYKTGDFHKRVEQNLIALK